MENILFSQSGKLEGKPYRLFMMKEPAFLIKIMSIDGDMSTPSDQENTRYYFEVNNGEQRCRKFKYTTVFSNHFSYRHIIGNHNNLRNSVPF